MKALKSTLTKTILSDSRNREILTNFLAQYTDSSDQSQNEPLELLVNNKTIKIFVEVVSKAN
jgi:hypothetical protein